MVIRFLAGLKSSIWWHLERRFEEDTQRWHRVALISGRG